jgi:M6 family metalloprotease-like protein
LHKKSIYFALLLIGCILSRDLDLIASRWNINSGNNITPFTHLIGIMVDFQSDVDSETSGEGKFLINQNIDLSYINYTDINRCNEDLELVIDLPPHNAEYFNLQLLSVKNYYNSISNGSIDFATSMLESVYTLDHQMSYYATSDQKIGLLFAEGLEKASNDLEIYINTNETIESINNVLFVVFHAGLGQEASQDFDPTIYDIRSAYIDSEMLSDTQDGEYWINDNNINNGILMPETLNWIFYDVIEDIFPPTFIPNNELENLYCDIQIGMSGLFAHLLGYYFGFPIMSDVDTGDTRIGKFGLMDVGWSNQSGIIPPRPNPWTRTNNNLNVSSWSNKLNKTKDLYTNFQNSEHLSINAQIIDNQIDEIFQIDISSNEYFLIENRSNRFDVEGEYANFSISDIINDMNSFDENYDIDNDSFLHLFDVVQYFSNLNDFNDYDIFEVDPVYNVVTKVKNYDYGLPGSGLLIWHIDEPDISKYNIGINNDLDDKAISLEEGDAVEHIGNPNYYLFQDFTKGNKSDFWYADNDFYQYVNYEGYDNQNYLGEDVFFDNNSIPNTRLKNNINSYLSFEIKDNISDHMEIQINVDSDNIYEMIYLGNNLSVVGNNSNGCVFYNSENKIYKKCHNQLDVELTQDDLLYGSINSITASSRILVDFNNNLYLADSADYYLNEENNVIPIDESIQPQGYYDSLTSKMYVSDALSLGDVDQDGFDEELLINNGNIECYNSNETLCQGFPIYGSFLNTPLIVDIMHNDRKPEIICENNGMISIYSNTGEFLLDIPNYSIDQEIQIIPNWSSDKAALVNGNRLFIFSGYQSESSYWHNPGSSPNNNFIVSGPENRQGFNEVSGGIDLSRTYNYPNPITNGYTKFRFFTYNADYVTVKIYDLSGLLVEKLSIDGLTHNDYNEIQWDASGLDSGLYFAEVRSDLNESKLIKVVLIK